MTPFWPALRTLNTPLMKLSDTDVLTGIGRYCPVPVFVYETETRTIPYANGPCLEALGYSRQDKAGLEGRLERLIYDEDKDHFEHGVSACSLLATDDVHSFLCRVNTKDDVTVSWQLTGRVFQRDASGQAEALLFFAKDICGEVQLVAEVRELERKLLELRRSNKELEEFAYIASHDLHEPLRKVHSFADRLKSRFGASPEEEAENYLNRILAATQNARLMIDGLMEFSRLSRNGFGFARVNMNDLVMSVLEDLELRIEETGSQVDVGILPSLEVIPVQMKQLFTNLIQNGIKFSRAGAVPHLCIEARLLDEADYAAYALEWPSAYYQFTVTDNGIGFDQAYAETIFQMFQRLHGKSEYPGYGIGLALCKKIADNHHGFIVANSTPGEGTIIKVILPETNTP